MTDFSPLQPSPESADALDHAREFVDLVLQKAPSTYRDLLKAPLIAQRLAGGRPFNHGKLYAWAEYLVFRAEFLHRFPQASQASCITAFSGLFLKNDISMTNLAAVMESTVESDLSLLARIEGSRDR